MKHSLWMTSGALALAGLTYAEQPTNSALVQEIDSLRNQLSQLQQKIDRDSDNRVAQLDGFSPEGPASSVSTTPPGTLSEPADPGKEPASKADIDGIRADLENYKYENQRNRETATALTARGTTISGSITARVSGIQPETNSGSSAVASPRNSSFDVPAANIAFGGSLYRDYTLGKNLDYRVQFAYARTSPLSDNSVFNLGDAYLRYNVLSTSGLENFILNATLGQQLLPFGLEAQTGEELRPVINSAQFLAGTGIARRQTGLIVRGDLFPYVDYGFNYRAPLVEYALGLVTGAGPNKADDNDAKDFIGRLAATLPVDYHSFFRELKAGASYYRGRKVLTRNIPVASQVGDAYAKQERYGLDLYYNHTPYGFTYEYVRGVDGAWLGEKAAVAAVAATSTSAAKPAVAAVVGHTENLRSEGQTFTLFYTIGNQFVRTYRSKAKYDDWWPQSIQLFGRYDYFDPNRNASTGAYYDTKVYTAGVNWFFAQTTKLQVNYVVNDFEDPAKKETKEFLGQFQFGF